MVCPCLVGVSVCQCMLCFGPVFVFEMLDGLGLLNFSKRGLNFTQDLRDKKKYNAGLCNKHSGGKVK